MHQLEELKYIVPVIICQTIQSDSSPPPSKSLSLLVYTTHFSTDLTDRLTVVLFIIIVLSVPILLTLHYQCNQFIYKYL